MNTSIGFPTSVQTSGPTVEEQGQDVSWVGRGRGLSLCRQINQHWAMTQSACTEMMLTIIYCLEGHVLIGLVLTLAAFLLLLLTTLSTPIIKGIYFLHSPGGISFGAFGYCVDGGSCDSTGVGYDAAPEVIKWLTRTQILWAIATALMFLALLALVLSLMRVGKFMWNPMYFRTAALLGTALGIAASIFGLVLWVTARHRYDAERSNGRAKYGAALWLGIAGTVLAFFAACVGGPAYAGNYGMHWANRGVAYNV